MPDFGIGETLGALGAFGEGGGLAGLFGEGGGLAGLFGGGAEAAELGGLGGALAADSLGGGAAAGAGAGLFGDFGAALPGLGGLDAAAGGAGSAATDALGVAVPGPAGAGAASFAPAPGVSIGGGIAPDATSAAALFPDAGSSLPFANATPFSGTVPDAASSALGAGGPNSLGGGAVATAGGAAPGGAAPGGALPSAGTGAGGFSLDKLGQGAIDSVTKNPLGVALGAGGLAYNMLQGQKELPSQKKLNTQADELNAQGQQLRSYLASGTLPPGLQASVDQAVAAAKARAISNAASQGLPTDPTKNTALATTLSGIDQQAPTLIAQIGQQLMTTGVQESGLSSQLYTTLAGIDQTQTANMGKAIANFAAALSPGGTKIQIGGTSA